MKRRTLLVLAGLVAAGGLLYLAGVAATGFAMARGTTIAGVDVGGMRPSSAEAELSKRLADRTDDSITLANGDQQFVLAPRDLGLELDVPASIRAAGGAFSWNPLDALKLFTGRGKVAPVVRDDEDKVTAAVKIIADTVDVPVTEPQITFPHEVPKARPPEPGLEVRREATAEAIRSAYLVARGVVKVPTAVVAPSVDADGLAQAMTDIAGPAMSGPVVLKIGGQTVPLPVTAYAPALTVRVKDGRMVPFLDAKELVKPLTDATTGIGQKAVDARIEIVDDKPKVIPGKPGVGLKPEEMAVKLLPVLTKSGDERSLSIQATAVEPDLTTEEAQKLGIREKIGEFTTYFPYAEYRNINQGRAAELINGTLLKPGETFSMNDIVGERTPENGFVKGFVINGGVFREEQGGGVSQVATTTYNAAFFAGLEDVEHHPHQLYISRYPVGREATVYYGALDLRFRDDTKTGVLVKSWVRPSTPGSQGAMHVELWGTKYWDIEAGLSPKRNFKSPATRYDDTDKCVPSEPAEGFDVTVYRYFLKDGVRVKTESDVAVYSATPKVICGPKPSPKPKPKATTKPTSKAR